MEYKGYNVSEVNSVLLLDILEELKSLKEMLKPMPIVEACKPVTEVKPQIDTISKAEVKKLVSKPNKSKSAAKKPNKTK